MYRSFLDLPKHVDDLRKLKFAQLELRVPLEPDNGRINA